MIHTCCEDGKLTAVSCCVCKYPLPTLCEGCEETHSIKPGFHFLLPLSAVQTITSQRFFTQTRAKLLPLHDSIQEVRQTLEDQLRRCEKTIEDKYEEGVYRLSEMKKWHLQRINELRDRLQTAMKITVQETRIHALEANIYIPDDPLLQLIWCQDPKERNQIFEFEAVLNPDYLDLSLCCRLTTHLSGFDDLNLDQISVSPQALISELNSKIMQLQQTHQNETRTLAMQFEEDQTRNETLVSFLQSQVQELTSSQSQPESRLPRKNELPESLFLPNKEAKVIISELPMSIFVDTQNGKKSVEVLRSDTIHNVKLKIQEKEAIPYSIQNLFYAGKVLDDVSTVADCGISRGSTLTLALKAAQQAAINICCWDSGFFTLPLFTDMTVEQLKVKIESENKVQPSQQSLFYESKLLVDNQTLRDYNVVHGSNIYLVIEKRPPTRIDYPETPGCDADRDPFICYASFTFKVMGVLTGREIIMTADRSWSIGTIKGILENMVLIPVAEQRLIYSGKELFDEQTLAICNIEKNSTVHLIRRISSDQIQKKSSTERVMQITIKTLTGKTITIAELSSNDTIETVMIKVQEKEGTPPAYQKMIFGGNYLQNYRTLGDYNISEDSPPIILILRFPHSLRVKIFIKANINKTIALQVSSDSTIEALKAQVEENEGIPATKQRLSLHGIQLEDDRTLGSYGILESTMELDMVTLG